VHACVLNNNSIPQVLNSMDLIKYDETLKAHLNKKELIESREESEIRAASIIACEKLKKLLNSCNSVELDFYLWVNFSFTFNFN
jgi:hypothetical protein